MRRRIERVAAGIRVAAGDRVAADARLRQSALSVCLFALFRFPMLHGVLLGTACSGGLVSSGCISDVFLVSTRLFPGRPLDRSTRLSFRLRPRVSESGSECRCPRPLEFIFSAPAWRVAWLGRVLALCLLNTTGSSLV